MKPLNCVICDTETSFYCKNIFKICSKHTETPILQYIEQFIGHSFYDLRQNETITDNEQKIVCQNCIIKLDEYDLSYSTAKRIEEDIRELLLQTEQKHSTTSCAFPFAVASYDDDDPPSSYNLRIDKGEEYLDDKNDVDFVVEAEDNSSSDDEFRDETYRPRHRQLEKPITTRKKEKKSKNTNVETTVLNVAIGMKCNVCMINFKSFEELKNHSHVSSTKQNKNKSKNVLHNALASRKYKKTVDADGKTFFQNFNGIMIHKTSTGKDEENKQLKEANAKLLPMPAYKCKKCLTTFFKREELKEHVKTHDDKISCEICGMKFLNKELLDEHKLRHEGKDPLQCIECGKEFTKRAPLTRHMYIHTGEKFFQCDQCGKEFLHYSSFRMHQLAHNNIRDKKCPHCVLSFFSNSHLNRHIRIHTGVKPYSCPDCGQKFSQRYNMMSHYKVHKGIPKPPLKTYLCTLCSATFHRTKQLSEHYRSAHDALVDASTFVSEKIKVE